MVNTQSLVIQPRLKRPIFLPGGESGFQGFVETFHKAIRLTRDRQSWEIDENQSSVKVLRIYYQTGRTSVTM